MKIRALLDEVGTAIKAYIDRELGTIRKSLDSLKVSEAQWEAFVRSCLPPKGDKGDSGDKGEKGDAGKSVTIEDVRPLLEATFSSWALDFERRAVERVDAQQAAALSKITQPKDGRDGLGFDDLEVEYDGERTLTFVMTRGHERKEASVRLPIPVYRHVWSSASDYVKSDMVTWGGQVWIALVDNTKEQPGTSSDWRLAVKKGRDGQRTNGKG